MLIKFWWREGTLRFITSPTHSMLLFKGCGFERERKKISGTTQIWYAHRMKVVLHQLVAWSWRLVVFNRILPRPVHDNRPKKTTASEFKEVYNVPYTTMAKNRTEIQLVSNNKALLTKYFFFFFYRFSFSLFKFPAAENQFR